MAGQRYGFPYNHIGSLMEAEIVHLKNYYKNAYDPNGGIYVYRSPWWKRLFGRKWDRVRHVPTYKELFNG